MSDITIIVGGGAGSLAAIAAEVERAQAAEAALSGAVADETARAEAEETAIRSFTRPLAGLNGTEYSEQRAAPEAGYLRGVFDGAGRRIGGFTLDGQFEIAGTRFGKPVAREANAVLAVRVGDRLLPITRLDGFNGQPLDVALLRGLDAGGAWRDLLPAPDIIAWGDSQFQGIGPYYQSWQVMRDFLAARGDQRQVTSLAAGATDSSQIAALADAAAITATVSGNAIPGDGTPVTVTALSPTFITATTSQQISGTIAGRRGMFVRASGGAITFYPVPSGSATAAPAGSAVRVDAGYFARCTQLIEAGRNDAGFSWPQIRDNVLNIVARQRTLIRRSIVLGITNASQTNPDGSSSGGPDETKTSAAYKAMRRANDGLAELFGNRFLDVHRYLVDHGIDDANELQAAGYFAPFGFTYSGSSQDTADIAADVVPTSLRYDFKHWGMAGSAVVGRLVARHILALGY